MSLAILKSHALFWNKKMPYPFDLLFFPLILTAENQKLGTGAKETTLKCEQVLKMREIITENRSYSSSS